MKGNIMKINVRIFAPGHGGQVDCKFFNQTYQKLFIKANHIHNSKTISFKTLYNNNQTCHL